MVVSEPEKTIVLAYENESMRRALARIFAGEGYRVVTYPSTESFLEGSPEGHPACLVLGVPCREINGFDVVDQLIKLSGEHPVVAVTVSPEVAQVMRAMSDGQFAVVQLPIEADSLVALVKRVEAQDAPS